jgi:putative redox protein
VKTELTVRAVQEGDMRVHASDGAFDLRMDYPLEPGTPVVGPTPLTVLLESLAACSLNSVIAVLKKMQQPVKGLSVHANATRSTEHPTVLKEISLEFAVEGEGVDGAAVARALQMSEERLCPVWNMLKASTAIRANYHLNRIAVHEAARQL